MLIYKLYILCVTGTISWTNINLTCDGDTEIDGLYPSVLDVPKTGRREIGPSIVLGRSIPPHTLSIVDHWIGLAHPSI